jgi:hypothetical protein
MAITRTQIAKQLLANGGRTGFFKAGLARGDDISPGTSTSGGDRRSQDRPNMRDIAGPVRPVTNPVFGDPDPEVDVPTRLRKDTGTSFLKNLNAERKANPFLTGASLINPIFGLPTLFRVAKQTGDMRKALGVQSPKPVDFSGMDRGGDVPYWAQLGYSSEAEYLAALARASGETEQVTEGDSTEEKLFDERFRRFRANGGRIGFFKGAQADASAGKGAMSPGTDTGGGFRGGGDKGPKGPPSVISKPPGGADKTSDTPIQADPRFDFGRNIGKGLPPKELAKLFNEFYGLPNPDEEEEQEQTITAGAEEGINISDVRTDPLASFIRNQPDFQNKIQSTISGIMANPDLANLGTIIQSKAEGGIIGGEYDFESARQMYGLGKLVKKVTRTVKKIAKSPVGKAALLYAGTGALGNLAGGSGLGGMFRGFTSPSSFLGGASNIFKSGGLKNILVGGEKLLGNPAKGNLVPFSGIFGSGGNLSALKAIGITSALAGLLTPAQEEEAQELARGEGIDIEAARRSILNARTAQDFRARRFVAEGGSMKEPVAKKTMPLLDMGGKEMDLRAEGGFVPIGRMEKADDVPARLSKNEFVFTADAVRNAGDGDVDKGAEVMYNMMKNLEAEGDVSEESQGLEGARKMFQTSQRLEEVL